MTPDLDTVSGRRQHLLYWWIWLMADGIAACRALWRRWKK